MGELMAYRDWIDGISFQVYVYKRLLNKFPHLSRRITFVPKIFFSYYYFPTFQGAKIFVF